MHRTCALRALICRSSLWRSAMPASLAAFSSRRVLLLLDSRCCILRSARRRSCNTSLPKLIPT